MVCSVHAGCAIDLTAHYYIALEEAHWPTLPPSLISRVLSVKQTPPSVNAVVEEQLLTKSLRKDDICPNTLPVPLSFVVDSGSNLGPGMTFMALNEDLPHRRCVAHTPSTQRCHRRTGEL